MTAVRRKSSGSGPSSSRMYFLTLFFDAVTKLIIVFDFVKEGCIGGFSDFRWGGEEISGGGLQLLALLGTW